MQSKQMCHNDKVGVIVEDDEFITSVSTVDSWWDNDQEDIQGASKRKAGITKVIVDTKNFIPREILDTDDNITLPSLNIKADELEEDGTPEI